MPSTWNCFNSELEADKVAWKTVASIVKELPLIEAAATERGVFDNEPVVCVCAEAGNCPICAAGENLQRIAVFIPDNGEFVMGEMPLGDDAVKNLDARFS